MKPLFSVLLFIAGFLGWSGHCKAQADVRYIHTDALGSVVAITDANRNQVERREYEPYGAQMIPSVKDGPGYTSHVQDAATGLVNMQQRYYDPMLGLFLSVDPVTAYSNPVGQFNSYRYANNNPYKFTDPDGRMIRDVGERPWGNERPIMPSSCGMANACLGGPGDFVAAHAAKKRTERDEAKNSVFSGDFIIVAELDFTGIWGGEFSGGVVIDLDSPRESGLFVTGGDARGVNAGVGLGFGYMQRELEGASVGLDVNLKLFSLSAQADGQGLNGGAITWGPGMGASISTTTTNTLSVNDLIEWLQED